MIRLASILAVAVVLFCWGQPTFGADPSQGVVALDNGRTYYQHPDGIFRENPPKGTCDCCKPQCTCEPGNKNPDCKCYPCKCHPTAAAKPPTITDIYGNVYTLRSDGHYWAGLYNAVPTFPQQQGCPDGRCPLNGTTPQTFLLQPTCPNCQRR